MLAEATGDYLSVQVDAGAEALMLFDGWAGLLSPAQFRRWVVEPRTCRRWLPAPTPQFR
jgi:uroporphyrinogen decarboxylase